MTETIHIVGAAARTAVGYAAPTTAAAIRCEISRVAEHPFLITADGHPLYCTWVPTVPMDSLGVERLVALGTQALADILAAVDAAVRTTVLVALPEERPGFGEGERARVLSALSSVAGGRATVRECGRGHAGAMPGLKHALESLSRGAQGVYVVGGVDSYLDARTLDWLDDELRLRRLDRRGGFPPGEGAAFFALTTSSLRQRLGYPSQAVLRGVACVHEPRDERSPEGLLGEALTEAYFEAAALLGAQARFEDLYCDINDERARTTDLGFALLRAGALFRDAGGYVTPVPSTGELGAATAPLNCILAARAWCRQYAHGPTALVSAASWKGLRAAAIFQQGETVETAAK